MVHRRISLHRPIDHLGIVVMAAAVTCLVLATSWGGITYAWSSPVILGLGAGAVVLSAAFRAVERRAAEPLIPMRLFRNRVFTLTTLVGLVPGVGMFACVGYLPTCLQMVYGVSATESGLLLIPMVAGIITGVTLAGSWCATAAGSSRSRSSAHCSWGWPRSCSPRCGSTSRCGWSAATSRSWASGSGRPCRSS